jgi:hypothetical protein
MIPRHVARFFLPTQSLVGQFTPPILKHFLKDRLLRKSTAHLPNDTNEFEVLKCHKTDNTTQKSIDKAAFTIA